MSTTEKLKIIGLTKNLTDPETDAPVTFFTLSQHTVRYLPPGAQCVLQGFINQASHAAGKRPLSHVAVDFTVAPEGDTEQWFYEQVLEKEGTALSGATAVLEVAKPDPATAESPSA